MNVSPDAEDDIHAELRVAMDEIQAREEPEIVETDPAPEPEAEGRTRGADGRFVGKEPEEAAEPETAPEVAADPADPAPEDAPVIPDAFAVAPQYAKKAVRENWAALPAEVRQELHEREREVHQALTRQDGERNFGKAVQQVVAPYEGFIKSLGAEPVQAFEYLLKTDYALRTASPEQKKAMFLQAAKDYGIDLGTQGEGNYLDPPVLQDPALVQRISQLETALNADKDARREQESAALNATIDAFAADPKNVFFDRVSPLMATLLQSGQFEDLPTAYEAAVLADPETRALHLAAKSEEEDRKRQAAAKVKTEAARAASVSVTGAPGQAAMPAQLNGSSGSIEDDIKAALAEVSSRV